MESPASRKNQLNAWLTKHCGLTVQALLPLVGDASFRRYYRVQVADQTYIAMDAPPPETCQPFVAVANALEQQGLKVPHVFAKDLQQGFLLLSDFGDVTFLKAFECHANPEVLYSHALNALAVMQACRSVPERTLPSFDADFMQKEWEWHKEWFTTKWLGLQFSDQDAKKLDAAYEAVVQVAANMPMVFMHRDYHSANLMWLENTNSIAILDFQDAFIGPVTYDLVSLLRDCYISWPESQVERWVNQYYVLLKEKETITASAQQFQEWFDWMGVQRQLKALLTFARKKVRDQQSQYLQHIPRTIDNLVFVTERYPAMSAIHHYLKNRVLPVIAEENLLCVP